MGKGAQQKARVAWSPQAGPQTALLQCPVPDVLFGGARGGGKTDALLGDFVRHGGMYPKARGIIFRRSMPELEEVQRRARELFPLINARWIAGARTWELPNGSTLKMRWLEREQDADRYQGHSYHWVGLDEVGTWPTPEGIDKLRSTMRSAEGYPCVMRLTANPGGPGHEWLKVRYVDPAPPMTPFFDEERRAWRVFIPSKLQDNKALLDNDPGYIDRIRASGPAWLVRAWLDGDWSASASGNIFAREWWRYYTLPPVLEDIVQSWDTGFKSGAENDPSVCTTWGVAPNGYYLLDCWTGRVPFPDLKTAALQLAAKWTPSALLIEDKASGQSLIQELQRATRLPVLPVKVDRDKIARASAITPLIESGRVLLPESAPWVSDFIEECSSFPVGAHDDRVDSMTQALDYLSHRAPPKLVFGGLPI